MRIVPAAIPVCSETSRMASSSCTTASLGADSNMRSGGLRPGVRSRAPERPTSGAQAGSVPLVRAVVVALAVVAAGAYVAFRRGLLAAIPDEIRVLRRADD